MNRFPLLLLLLLTISLVPAKSALFLQLYTDDLGASVEPSDFPNLSVKIKAYDQGQLVNLEKENFYIVEDKYASRPFSITKVEDDYYKVVWKTGRVEFKSTETATVYVNYNGETKSIEAGYFTPQVASFIMCGYDPQYSKALGAINGPINLGLLNSNQTYTYYYCIDTKAPLDSITMQTDAFSMDSITLDNDQFEIEWLGSRTDGRPLPNNLMSSRYLLKMKVTPKTDDVIQTEIVFHYEPGIKKRYLIVANKMKLDVQTTLQLIEPNGGQIFTPCEDVLVKWRGHIKSLPVIVSYSTDRGNSWKAIASVTDSTYMWKVPNEISEDVMLRVNQEYKEEPMIRFVDNNYSDIVIGYDNASTQLVTAARAGKVNLYDLINKKIVETHYLGYKDDLTYRFNIIGTAFTEANDSYIVAYNDANKQQGGSYTFFRKYSVGKTTPDYTVSIGNDFTADEMFKDNTSKYIVFKSVLASKVLVYNLETGVLVKEIDLKHPITTMELSRKQPVAIVSNLNNDINIYSIPDFNLLNNIKQDGQPFLYDINISPNGKYAMLAQYKELSASGPYYTNLLEINTGAVVAFTGHNYSKINEIQFNPSSITVAIASSGVPQLSFLDLKINGTLSETMSIGGNNLFDFQYAPDGHSVASTMERYPFVDIRYFNYPEYDESDNTFAIRYPEVAGTETKIIPMHLIAEERSYTFSDFCNIGDVKLFIKDAYFKEGKHFKLQEDFSGDTLLLSECMTYNVTVNPKDVGMLSDTLIVAYCQSEIKIPFEVESQNRHLGFDNDPLVISEEVCLGNSFVEKVKLFTNLDPIPIKINYLDMAADQSKYRIISRVRDTIIPAGGSLEIEIEFSPSELGINADSIKIIHSDNAVYYIPLKVEGIGIGAFVSYSHDALPFIKEITERDLQITNTGVSAFSLKEWKVEPEGAYEVVTPLPISFAPEETKTVRIKWNENYTGSAELSWTAEPCLMQSKTALLQYESNYELSIPNIETKPLDMVAIPLMFSFTENVAYKGNRDFVSEIKLYKRLFKPESVNSEFGEATILEETTDDYYRYIKIKVNGDFDATNGVAASILGYPGLADVVETKIEYSEDLPQWGANTHGSTSSGKLTVVGVGDRRLLSPDNPLYISGISPNPAANIVKLEFETKTDLDLEIKVLDNLGQSVISLSKTHFEKAESNIVNLDCSELPQGNYTAVVESNNHTATIQLIIIR